MKSDLAGLITQAEAARIRGVSRAAINNLIARGKFETVEIAGQKFVKRSQVENYEPELGGRPAAAQSGKPTQKRGSRKK